MTEYTFTNGKDAKAFARSHGGPIDIDVQQIERGNWVVTITEQDDVLSTEDAMDMSEVFEAEALGAEAVAELEAAVAAKAAEPEPNEEHERMLADLRVARDTGDRATRRTLIKDARAAGIKGQDVADAAGVSITYVYDVANGNTRTATPALSKQAQGYQEALADIEAIIRTTASFEAVMEWIANNRSAQADAIFARALAERENPAA